MVIKKGGGSRTDFESTFNAEQAGSLRYVASLSVIGLIQKTLMGVVVH